MIAAALLACGLNVAPVTLEAIIRTESDGNPLALHVNRLAVQPPPARDAAEAAAIARRYIAAGYTVDIGTMQVNSAHLGMLGTSVEQLLDPCTNIRFGGEILTDDYARASQQFGAGQPALLAALSAYNTGTWDRGFANGYVARVLGSPLHRITAAGATLTLPPNPYTATTLAFGEVPDVVIN